jgi:hypothetical protein
MRMAAFYTTTTIVTPNYHLYTIVTSAYYNATIIQDAVQPCNDY